MDEPDFHRALFRPGTLIDIGAHSGSLTLALADLAWTRILAFEPLPTAFVRLQRAVRRHWGRIPAHVVLRPEALGETAGTLTLEVPIVAGAAQEQWASVAKDYAALQAADPRIESVRRYAVPVLPLDALELDDVTAIKLDAEGAEEEVLRGAAATLRRCQPVLSVEIEERHRPGSTRRVPDLLRQLGYEGWYEFYGDWRPIERFDATAMQRASPSPASFEVSDPYVFCFYFIPPARRPDLAALARVP
jgi:FkbM family methyltransferase